MDSYLLTGPDGRVVNLGSYVQADPGPDFGAKDLVKAVYAENPAVPGGALAFEQAGVRRMSFPLILPSSSAFAGGLAGLEATLRALARPGAHVDLLPDGVATGDAVRFDVLAGRWEERYAIREHAIGVRQGDLHLDVQPFGYLPTMILLASSASVGMPGLLTVPNASLIGDVPGLVELVVAPTTPTNYPGATWLSDAVVWSLGARASFQAHWPAASVASMIPASLAGDAFAAGSQALQVFPSPTQAGWTQIAQVSIPASLEPAYRGRFRAFAWAKLTPSQALPWMLSMDVSEGVLGGAALASSQPVATLPPAVASGAPGAWGAQPSNAHLLLDMGEVSLPAVGSGLGHGELLRLWAKPATSNVGVATPVVAVGGFYMLPLDGGAGFLPRGLAQPTTAGSVGRLALDSIAGRAVVAAPTGGLASTIPFADARAYYRGDMPRVGASTLQLDVLGGGRSIASGATTPLARSAPAFAAVSVRYQPRFLFMKSV